MKLPSMCVCRCVHACVITILLPRHFLHRTGSAPLSVTLRLDYSALIPALGPGGGSWSPSTLSNPLHSISVSKTKTNDANVVGNFRGGCCILSPACEVHIQSANVRAHFQVITCPEKRGRGRGKQRWTPAHDCQLKST